MRLSMRIRALLQAACPILLVAPGTGEVCAAKIRDWPRRGKFHRPVRQRPECRHGKTPTLRESLIKYPQARPRIAMLMILGIEMNFRCLRGLF